MTPRTSTNISSSSATSVSAEGTLTDLSVFMTAARTLRERVEGAVAQWQDSPEEEREQLRDAVASDVRTMARLSQNFLDRLLGSEQWAQVCGAGLVDPSADAAAVDQARAALRELDEAHGQFVESLHSDIDSSTESLRRAREAFELAQQALGAAGQDDAATSEPHEHDGSPIEQPAELEEQRPDWTGTPYDLYAAADAHGAPGVDGPDASAAVGAGLQEDVVALVGIAGAAAALEDLLVGVHPDLADDVRRGHLEELTALDEDFRSLDAELRDIQEQQDSLERDRQELDGAGRGSRRNRKLRAILAEESERLEQAAMGLLDGRASLSAARFAVLESVAQQLAGSSDEVRAADVAPADDLLGDEVESVESAVGGLDADAVDSGDEFASGSADDVAGDQDAEQFISSEDSAEEPGDTAAVDAVAELAAQVSAAEVELRRHQEALEAQLSSYADARAVALRSVEEAEADAQDSESDAGFDVEQTTPLEVAWLVTLASFPRLVDAARDAVTQAASPIV